VILGGASGPNDLTASDVYAGAGGHLIPILITALLFAAALAFFRREGRYFAERL
jgi:hypothetical protein